jgi:hypothetical protein
LIVRVTKAPHDLTPRVDTLCESSGGTWWIERNDLASGFLFGRLSISPYRGEKCYHNR